MSSEQSILAIPVEPQTHKDVWIYAEMRHGKMMPTAFELLGVAKSLAKEVAKRNITVNGIAPGYIDTAMVRALTDAQRASAVAEVPTDRFGTPEEVAAAVVFLASDEAAYITGQTLHINGGMHIE